MRTSQDKCSQKKLFPMEILFLSYSSSEMSPDFIKKKKKAQNIHLILSL